MRAELSIINHGSRLSREYVEKLVQSAVAFVHNNREKYLNVSTEMPPEVTLFYVFLECLMQSVATIGVKYSTEETPLETLTSAIDLCQWLWLEAVAPAAFSASNTNVAWTLIGVVNEIKETGPHTLLDLMNLPVDPDKRMKSVRSWQFDYIQGNKLSEGVIVQAWTDIEHSFASNKRASCRANLAYPLKSQKVRLDKTWKENKLDPDVPTEFKVQKMPSNCSPLMFIDPEFPTTNPKELWCSLKTFITTLDQQVLQTFTVRHTLFHTETCDVFTSSSTLKDCLEVLAGDWRDRAVCIFERPNPNEKHYAIPIAKAFVVHVIASDTPFVIGTPLDLESARVIPGDKKLQKAVRAAIQTAFDGKSPGFDDFRMTFDGNHFDTCLEDSADSSPYPTANTEIFKETFFARLAERLTEEFPAKSAWTPKTLLSLQAPSGWMLIIKTNEDAYPGAVRMVLFDGRCATDLVIWANQPLRRNSESLLDNVKYALKCLTEPKSAVVGDYYAIRCK